MVLEGFSMGWTWVIFFVSHLLLWVLHRNGNFISMRKMLSPSPVIPTVSHAFLTLFRFSNMFPAIGYQRLYIRLYKDCLAV